MDRHQFAKHFNDFNECYNHAYTEAQGAQLFKYASPLSSAEFGWKLQQVMENEIRPPSVGKIKSFMRESVSRARIIEMDRMIKEEPACVYCDKTGQITAVERSTKISYAFRCIKCKCADVRFLSMDFYPWNDELLKYFEIILFTSDSVRNTYKLKLPDIIAGMSKEMDLKNKLSNNKTGAIDGPTSR